MVFNMRIKAQMKLFLHGLLDRHTNLNMPVTIHVKRGSFILGAKPGAVMYLDVSLE